MRSDTRWRQLDRLTQAVDELRGEILALEESALDRPLGNWSPRHVVAHLVGWNLGLIEGCHQLLRGELPFYDREPGEDYCRINERFVREHATGAREDLLGALAASADRLARFVKALEPGEWSRQSGVMHGEENLTVRDTVDDLIDDYRHHSQQLRAWSDAAGGD